MTSTCLVCYQDSQVFILPPCNHRDICWKCCLKLVKGSIFVCPFCNDKPDIKSQLLFVSADEMQIMEHQSIMKSSPFRSNKNTFYFYSNAEVAQYIESQTSFHCVRCGEVHESINLLKKHLYSNHKLQFCDVCLDNRRCINAEQHLYTQGQLMVHLKQGDISQTGQVILYHPKCQFCARPFYDIQAFKLHLKMSSHMKCQICQVNSTKLKYVYYKDYPELEAHHRKTHFVCYVGDCVGKKLENVFASQALLQQHKRKCHRKYKGDKNERVQNILLGFNKTLEQQHIQFDGIGRNLEKQFTIFERQQRVQKQVHNDQFIDIRQFYPQMCKNNIHTKSQDIAARVIQLIHSYGLKPKEVHFNQIHLFKPLQMPSLSRIQCEKMIKRCFQLRDAEAIIEIFFTKRNQYHSFDEFFQAIQKRMKAYSTFSFYYIFPQLIRFMKDQNKNKVPMDEYYSIKLRLLIVNKLLLFHAFDRYSQLLQFLRNQLQFQMKRRCEDTSLNLEKYCKYMKQMNINYYINEQDQLFFVSKQKATNLYHMIERCKTKDFLKMNWLLKLGLSQQTYQHMMKNVYSKTKQQCEDNIFKPYRMKQMALMSLYLKICLQALNDKISFEQNKRNAKAYYLTEFLETIPRPANISPKILNEIRMLQGCSHNIEKKTKQRTTKMVVVNDEDCPSLLRPQTVGTIIPKKNSEVPELGLGKSRLPIWNEEQSLRKKKNPIQPQKRIQQQDNFPALVVPEGMKTQIGRSKVNSKRTAKQEQQDFPVYNFKEKFVTPEPINKIEEKRNNITQFLGFNSKLVVNNVWDQNKTRQRFDQYQKFKEIQTPINKKGNKKNQASKAQSDLDEDQYFKLAIQQSLKTAAQEKKIKNNGKKQENMNNQSFKKQVQETKAQQQKIIISKKNKNQQQKPEKKNNKQKNKKDEGRVENSSGKKQEPQYLFQQIQKEAKIIDNKQKKQPRLRIDYSDDSEEKVQQKKMETTLKPPQQKYLNKNVVQFDDEQFMTIGSLNQGKQSIINKIQKQSSQNQEKKNNKVVKNGKKGKVIIQSVPLL